MIVADTDVLVDFLRRGPSAERIELEIRTGRLATTSIAVFELWQGARTDRSMRDVETLFDALDVMPLTAAAARRAGIVRRDLLATKSDIGVADSLVAGICLESGALLLTRNRAHFERVPGLHLGRVET